MWSLLRKAEVGKWGRSGARSIARESYGRLRLRYAEGGY